MSDFQHLHAGHCESGVTAALLGHAGLNLSEAMIFGLGSGIFFVYPPLIRIMGMPLISFRSYPGGIFKHSCRRLGVTTEQRSFASKKRGTQELDSLLEQRVPVGLRTNMFWLSYFPREFRSQFNGHNLIALARDGDNYRISDPVLAEPVEIDEPALTRSRFAKGALAPRGALYFVQSVPTSPNLAGAIKEAVRDTATRMQSRVPILGVRGIRRLAKHVRGWAHRVPDDRRRRLLLGHVVRMQEEVGTGGAGFRFMYAAFLQEAGELLGHEPFLQASEMMTEAGDLWRTGFAGTSVRIIKDRRPAGESLEDAADCLERCADKEAEVFQFLRTHLPAS